MGPLAALILAIIIISAVVGVIAQFLNKLNEANAVPPGRRPPQRGGPPRPGQAERDMDRFLAEIDRLRKKNTQNGEVQNGREEPKPPVAKPAREIEKPKPRIAAEPAQASGVRTRTKVDEQGFVIQPSAPPVAAVAPRAKSDELPVATVVEVTAGPASLATVSQMSQMSRLTAIPGRARPLAKTDLAKNLNGLLDSGQGIAMAVILKEVLGPPKCKT